MNPGTILVLYMPLKPNLFNVRYKFQYISGIVGDWKSMFSVTQNETFDELYHTRMNKSKLNIRFSIPEKLPAKSRSVFH